jgi:phosphoglucosamine mutase
VNVRLTSGFDALSAAAVLEAPRDAEAKLGNKGRVLLRKSGTEPLVRVMVEGEDGGLVKKLASDIANVIVKQSQN